VRQLQPGDELAGYTIEELAARGGMGLVYRARQHRPDRTVAIKVIAPELAADPDFRARFEQESATAAEIEHPNVIPVYEVGEESGLLFISMRFVHGVDLGRLMEETGPVAPERAANLIAQVADALDAAHARGLIHRDVKPGNIMVAERDHVYLTDFGLTKRATDSHGVTRTGMFVGTVDYIAPEQVEGRHVDARADIYALGCVAYELLSGSIPFPRDSDVAKIFAHVNDPPPLLSNVPEPLATAVARAMAKRPEDRFQSAGDFGRAVLAGAAGRVAGGDGRTVATGRAAPIDPQSQTRVSPTRLAAPAGTPPSTQAPRSQRRWLLPAGLATAVVAIGAVVAIVLASSGSGTGTTTSGGTTSTKQSTTSSPAATVAKIYNPVNPAGGLAVSVTRTLRGNCFTTSIVASRPDAFRCMSGNAILDPCFMALGRDAACPINGPWTNQAVLLKNAVPNSGTPNKDTGTGGQPWAIQLPDGTNCEELSGATTLVAGQRLGFGCTGGAGLYGNVHRSGAVWMIYEGTAHSATLALKPIAVAWF
jgi:predicted Ser/Thr protein kinase